MAASRLLALALLLVTILLPVSGSIGGQTSATVAWNTRRRIRRPAPAGWMLGAPPRGGESVPVGADAAVASIATTSDRLDVNSTSHSGEESSLQEDAAVPRSSSSSTKTTQSCNTNSELSPSESAANIPSWRKALPTQLQSKGPKTLQKICMGHIDIYLLGTAHVSNDSSTDVRLILNHLQPECVFVELCDARIALLEAKEVSSSSKSTAKQSMLERIKETQQVQGGSRLQALSTVLLTSVQEDYAESLCVELGGEFRCAHSYWKNCTVDQRPHLVLGDRPLQLTLVRAWESLGWWPKIKVIVGLLWSSLRKPDKKEIREWLEAVMREESDVLTESFQDLRRHFPTLYTTIISERDAYLAAKLTQTCFALSRKATQTQRSNERIKLVAIVGAGHVPGICKWLTNQTSTKTPEEVLAELVTTKRWATDEHMERELIPAWINEVTELHDNPTIV